MDPTKLPFHLANVLSFPSPNSNSSMTIVYGLHNHSNALIAVTVSGYKRYDSNGI